MAKKPGLFRQLFNLVRGRQERQAPTPPPTTPKRTTTGATVYALRRQAVSSIRRLPMVNVDEVRRRVQLMSPDELQWTIGATIPELRWRARQDADRLTQDDIPMNPWWYK